MNVEYLNRIFDKYNRDHIQEFLDKKPKRDILSKFYLSDEELQKNELSIFKLLHCVKYYAQKAKKNRKFYEETYFSLRNSIVKANIGLVHECVKQHVRRYKIAFNAEYVSLGLLTLVNCVDCFDPWKGAKLSTYVFNSVKRGLFNIKKNKLLSNSCIFNAEEVEDNKEGEEKDDTKLRIDCLNRILDDDTLSDREKIVIKYRFNDDESKSGRKTLREIGEKMGLSKEWVRKIQEEALAKIRIKFTTFYSWAI